MNETDTSSVPLFSYFFSSFLYNSYRPQPTPIMYIPIPSYQQSIPITSPSVISLYPLSAMYSPYQVSLPSSSSTSSPLPSSTSCSLVSDVFGYHTEGRNKGYSIQ